MARGFAQGEPQAGFHAVAAGQNGEGYRGVSGVADRAFKVVTQLPHIDGVGGFERILQVSVDVPGLMGSFDVESVHGGVVERNAAGVQILFHVLKVRRAGYEQDVRCEMKEPGQADLRRCDAELRGHGYDSWLVGDLRHAGNRAAKREERHPGDALDLTESE